ncbi:hypothetical protein, partial [Agathobaculum sp.]|uniref:hypothetical protein n=1 Tax=Agathobaculum sp. TaxID=2048138 RepID=UPI00307C59C7
VSKPRYTPPVLMRLHRKRYSMRAAARLPFLHENKLYRQTEQKPPLRVAFAFRDFLSGQRPAGP